MAPASSRACQAPLPLSSSSTRALAAEMYSFTCVATCFPRSTAAAASRSCVRALVQLSR